MPAAVDEENTKQEPTVNEEELYGVDLTKAKDGGVRKIILVEGSQNDQSASEGCTVFVRYVGRFLDGEIFDSNLTGDPFEFVLGEGVVIQGWDIGVATMKKGEKAKLTIKPEYGYGQMKGNKIPPNSTLQFEIELLDWKGTNVTKDGQVTKIVVKKGIGYDRPNTGAQVEAHITGSCGDKVFEDRDIAFTFGEGSEIGLIDGLEEAISKMMNKETAKVFISPGKYGYGANGKAELGVPPNAALTYLIDIKNFEKFSEAWELSNEEKIATALRMKDKGTKFFKEGKIKIACRQYSVVVKMLEGYFDNEELQKTNPIKVAGHLNIAACQLKLGNNQKCIKECEKALEIDKESIKALFRRGKAQLMLKDYDQAKVDFLRVLELDPRNREAREQLNIVNQKLKAYHQREKKIFANMFEKLASKDKQEEEKTEPSKDIFKEAVEQAAVEMEEDEGSTNQEKGMVKNDQAEHMEETPTAS